MESYDENDKQLIDLFRHLSSIPSDVIPEEYFKNKNELFATILQMISTGGNGFILDTDTIAGIVGFLQQSITPSVDCDIQTVTQSVTNCVRVCRNLCALCSDNQDLLYCNGRVVDTFCDLIVRHLQLPTPCNETLVLLRCSVQFLGNYASGKPTNQTEVWQKLQTLFFQLLQVGDEKLQEYIMIVLHICLDKTAVTMETGHSGDLICAVIKYAMEKDTENGLFVIEDLLKTKHLCENVFKRLTNQAQLLLLEVLISDLKRLPEDGTVDEGTVDIPSVENLQFIAADFILQSHLIPKMTGAISSNLQHEALITVKQLECLCLATGHHTRYRALQDHPNLISAAIGLLQAVQELGRQGNNVFTNVEKVSQEREINPDHPVFGLKRDLIRLLGNMAYRHRENQDMVRELDGLALIMEQTNIDGKNPFITQWSVFAIHNLTEGNEDNRLYLASMKMEGVANNQSVLEEMGVTAEADGEKVVIKKKRMDR